MEQETNADISAEQLEDSSNSPPWKRPGRQPEDILQQPEVTCINAATTDDHLIGAEYLIYQQSAIQSNQ